MVAVILAIHKAMKQVILDKYSKVIIENDLLIDIQAINKKSILSRKFCNDIEDIIMLTKEIDTIKFVYC